jgi:site-specific recombinase XerD
VLDAVDSAHTRRAYRCALTDLLNWHRTQGSPAFTKALLQRYRSYRLDEGLGASSINQRLVAIKKQVHEAADNQLLDSAVAASHDLSRTFAKLSRNGGAELDQIKASLGHASVQTTERYVGETQRVTDASADRIGLRVKR